MGDSFECLVDVEVGAGDARDAADRARQRLIADEIVVSTPDPTSVVGGTGYRPGPRILELYHPSRGEARFWRAKTNGVEIEAGRFSNVMFPFDASPRCPKCDAQAPIERFIEAAGRWAERDDDGFDGAMVECARCEHAALAPDWKSSPPIVFGHLSLRFWNWPPLTASGWRIDIVKLVSEALGHRVEVCWGRL